MSKRKRPTGQGTRFASFYRRRLDGLPAVETAVAKTRRVQSSIDVLIPEVTGVVGERCGLTQAAADGMAPHITLLWPWLEAPVPSSAIRRAGRAIAGSARFTLTFTRCDRFPGVVYLVPEAQGLIDGVIRSLVEAFPETPPFGGEFGSAPIPHLTAAKSDDEAHLDVVQSTLNERLSRTPITVVVFHVSVSEEGLGADGRWGVRAELPLA